jgi:hypothetical protein
MILTEIKIKLSLLIKAFKHKNKIPSYMRTFSNFERGVMRYIVDHNKKEVLTGKLFTQFCNFYLLQWSEDYKNFSTFYSEQINWDEVIRPHIFDLLVLLQYLESEKYIGIFPANILKENRLYNHSKYQVEEINNDPVVLEKESGNKTIELKLTKQVSVQENSSIGKSIKYYANSTYHVTQTLIDFVNNNFQTSEDIRYKHNNLQTWIGIGVAIVIGILGIISNFIICYIRK